LKILIEKGEAMSKVKKGHIRSSNNSEKCFSWNACEDKLQDCISRNQLVKEIRKKLAKKKIDKSTRFKAEL
jgi:hypothetical protein